MKKIIFIIVSMFVINSIAYGQEEINGKWNFQSSRFHSSRSIMLIYSGKPKKNTIIPLYSMLWHSDLGMTRSECQEDAKMYGMDTFQEAKDLYLHSKKQWYKKMESGLIGMENYNGLYHFGRVICVPEDIIVPMDLVGGKTYIKDRKDPRFLFRFDRQKFFAAFGKYGVTETIDLGKKNWDKEIFIFPLDRANE